MRYVVHIQNTDGTGRIDLSDGTDGDKAAELVSALTSAASGKGFDVGVSITQETQSNESGGTAQPVRPAQRGQPANR